ncbi:MAG: HypC/HybG/HupF family hydrogenase formation chaperone [Candidatus Diapherotrites archaeon]
MCLAVPGRVVKAEGKGFVIDYGTEQRTIKISTVDAKEGDWVLVQQGMIVEKLGEKEAMKAIKAWQQAER